ncbi:hypothetical protein ACIPW5_39865 [Streptomyces sp. NPDC090077]|uniref:hypothetical protein n=1 Tax=Streptomyces sp. NPDC090077 TaxID=3365938 RepID=UPI00380414A2
MKLRSTLGACLGALTLVLSMSGSAQAAQGNFHFKYVDGYGHEQYATLHDPHSGKCINLYPVGDDDELPGYAPHNQTDTAVTVYLNPSCEGPQWRLRANGSPAKDTLEVRSVRFDAP